MTLAECLDQVEQHGSGYTVELLRYDGNERTVDEFKRHEGLGLLQKDATLEWASGSHSHEGEHAGQIVLPGTITEGGTAEHPHNVILIRYHQARQ